MIAILLKPAVIFGLPTLCGLVITARMMWRYNRRAAHHAEILRKAQAAGGNIPPSLHPVIDPNVCIGSQACTAVCPEGDVLAIVRGLPQLVEASHCIGHGECAAACPVNAIRLVFGSSERGVDLPELDHDFESTRQGVHIVGELGGMGLIKNAIVQGLQVADCLRARLGKPRRAAGDPTFDVLIVGAGPAGLAAAVGCRAHGLSFAVLEQGSLGGTIANYPRQKVIMSEPVELPLYGTFGARKLSKEDLLETWTDVAKVVDFEVNEGIRVDTINGEDGSFELQTSGGAFRARKVVLALGRRGTPRKLGVAGEQLEKVTYRLVNPEQYNDCNVLVVGGGDSALESVIMLAEFSDATVAISYRGDGLGRCRRENREKVTQLIADGRVSAYFGSQIDLITAVDVQLTQGGRSFVLKNDYVLVHIGGTLPEEFLAKVGIETRRHFGAEAQPIPKAAGAKTRAPVLESYPSPFRNFLFLSLFIMSTAVLLGLTLRGWHYYQMPRAVRATSQLHKALRPSGLWGHGIGVVATFVMMFNFLYAVRKRVRRFRDVGTLREWLNLHMLIGTITPIFIAFHAAFQSNNLLATTTAGSLLVVVGTGIFGRFVYGLIPSSGGRAVELSDLLGHWEQLRQRMSQDAVDLKAQARFDALFRTITAPPNAGLSPVAIMRDRLLLAPALHALRPAFISSTAYEAFKAAAEELAALRLRISGYERLRHFMMMWRIFHIVLSGLLVVIIAAHITVSLALGFGWVFF